MKRLAIIFAVALALSGCAGDKSVFQGGTSLTATVNNPVTLEMQAALEAGYGVVATAAVNYARLPRCKAGEAESLTNLCSRWSVVQKLKTANRIAYAAINKSRDFVGMRTISAVSVFNSAVAALNDYKAIAYINNVK